MNARAALAALLAFAIAGCASRPSSDARYWSIDQCADFAEVVVRFPKQDGTHLASVDRITCQLLRSATRRIEEVAAFKVDRIGISDVEEPNAFAATNDAGKPIVVVTVGMLVAIGPDVDAWAGLLGHELAHHVQRHADGRASATSAARVTGNVVANAIAYAVPGFGGLIGGTAGGALTQSAMYGAYTRPQEAEADELALKWMAAAGYDPRGLLRLFEILAKRSALPAFLSTHPATEERARAVERFLEKKPD